MNIGTMKRGASIITIATTTLKSPSTTVITDTLGRTITTTMTTTTIDLFVVLHN